LFGTNCYDDVATLLDKLKSVLRAPNVSLQNHTSNHDKETPDDVPERFYVAQQIQKTMGAAVHAGVGC
jgi:hypothetical protein